MGGEIPIVQEMADARKSHWECVDKDLWERWESSKKEKIVTLFEVENMMFRMVKHKSVTSNF